jgi:hypothetical protein
MSTPPSTCVLCGMPFNARHNYGLCPICSNQHTLREFDRWDNAVERARKAYLPADLSFAHWLATISDFKGLCAYCRYMHLHSIQMVNERLGLTYDNIVPICEACRRMRRETFQAAERRIAAYLQQPKNIQISDMLETPEYV